jgi:DNA polymerase-4
MPTIGRRGLTLVGVTVADLEDDGAIQLLLPLDRRSTEDLDAALDSVRDRYGTNAVTRAVLLGRRPLLSLPQLPD